MKSKNRKRLLAGMLSTALGIMTLGTGQITTFAQECLNVSENKRMITEASEDVLYRFVPQKTGTYQFYSVKSGDTYGCIYDANKNVVYSDNDSGTDLNFSISAELKANTTYYLAVDYFELDEEGKIQWKIQKVADEYVEVKAKKYASAQGKTVEGAYEYVEDDDTITITNYTGTEEVVQIPETIDGKAVTAIAEYAFEENMDMKELVIPKTVTEVQYAAFVYCENLETLTFAPESTLKTLGGWAFGGCSSLKSVDLPDSVTIMEGGIFSQCSALENVQLGKNIICVDGETFLFCENLTEIVIPESVIEIGYYAFGYCNNLEKITIPKTVKTIRGSAFEGTAWLENRRAENPLVVVNTTLIDGQTASGSVIIPEGVTVIGEEAFLWNSEITEVVIPKNAQLISAYAFYCCENLNKVVISEGVTTIEWCAFAWSENLTEIEIPKTVTHIEGSVFEGTAWLENKRAENPLVVVNSILVDGQTASGVVIIPEDVTVIMEDAFSYNYEITEVTIPKSVKEIQLWAFSDCTNLTEVTIEEGVTTIDNYAFGWCYNLEKITIPSSVTNIAEDAFWAVNEVVIYGYENSYAQQYAKEQGIPFEILEDDNELPVIPPTTNPFTDVSDSMYYYQPVLWALENKVTAGINATQFAPEQSCTRGQVVTFFWRAMGCPEPSTTTNPFVDVDSNQYYYKAVLWALENGITAGIDATHFAPDETVTRGQFVTFLHRAENKPSYTVNNPFTDVPNTYYYDAVLWAYENGVTAGTDATHFSPEEFCTRGQVVTFLYRALNEK